MNALPDSATAFNSGDRTTQARGGGRRTRVRGNSLRQWVRAGAGGQRLRARFRALSYHRRATRQTSGHRLALRPSFCQRHTRPPVGTGFLPDTQMINTVSISSSIASSPGWTRTFPTVWLIRGSRFPRIMASPPFPPRRSRSACPQPPHGFVGKHSRQHQRLDERQFSPAEID